MGKRIEIFIKLINKFSFKFHNFILWIIIIFLNGCLSKPVNKSSNGVDSISPISGPTAGGNTLAINGANLTSISKILIGSQPCTGLTKNSSSLTCTIPSNPAGTYPVTISDSVSTKPLATFSYTYVDSFAFTKIEPATGFAMGGNLVTITGSGFDMQTNVLIGGQQCWGIFIIDPTKLTCYVSSHSPGAVNIQLTNSAGNIITTNNSPFNYFAAPKITTISPSYGAQGGGTKLTITGTDLQPGLTVYLDSAKCDNLTLNSNRDTITCTTGSYAYSGNVSVSVNNPDTQFDTKINAFYYLAPPTLSTITPSSAADGTTITISTSNYFYNVKSVKIDGVDCTGISSTANKTSTLTCTAHVGSHFGIQVPVVVTNGDDQVGYISTGFTFITAPSNLSLSISHGSTNGNYPITVSGFGIRSGAKVLIGNTPCVVIGNNISQDPTSQSSLTCTVPQSTSDGQAIVKVINLPDGLFAQTDPSLFTYIFPPKISGISPARGADNGGDDITITGEHFSTTSLPVVNFGNVPCSIISNTSTVIHCSSPRESGAGTVPVVVTNPDSQASSSSPFTFVSSPVITNVSPSNGNINGSTYVTVTGTGFTNSSYIKFGNIPCTGATFTITGQVTSLSCYAPAQSAATVSLSVVNSDGGTATGRSFVYRGPPVVSIVKPAGGSINGGTQIEIDGTGFLNDANITVKIGQINCVNISFTINNNITCYTPAADYSSIANSPQNVVVTNSDGQSGSIGGAYTFENAPSISSITPNFGPTRGGGITSVTPIVIVGNNFVGSSVKIGGSVCTPVSLSSGEIQCLVTSHISSGAFDVVITNSDNQFTTAVGGYTYYSDPTITSVTPSFGISSGVNPEVTIKGTDFRQSAQVKFGTDSCTSVAFDNVGQIRCTPPVRVAGSVPITVTNTDDNQTITSQTPLYTYRDAPTISSVSPKGGPKAGNATVTITGTNFITDINTQVKIGGNLCSIASTSAITATTITCTTPGSNTLGSFDVQVINADGQVGTKSLGYTYQAPPTFSSVSPGHGVMGGSELVTVSGTNFINPHVYINGQECISAGVPNTTSYPCYTPSSLISGSLGLSIVNEDNQTDSSGKFIYYSKPGFTRVIPANGFSAGGNSQITITGSGFRSGVQVQLVDAANIIAPMNCANTTFVDAATITCTPPAHAAGTVKISITNDDGQSDSSGSYIYRNAPAVTSVASTPAESTSNSGPATGGNTLKISGTGFYNNAVTIKVAGNITCGSVTYNNIDGSLSCVVPVGSYTAGATTLVVTNDDSQSSSAFTYTFVSGPLVSSLSSHLGAVAGSAITITGSNFNNPNITFGGKPCINIISTATQINCTTPSVSAGGPVNVVITNIDGQSITLANGFIYIDPPSISSLSFTSGKIAGGNTITVIGNNFLSGASVKFGSSFSSAVTFVDAQHLNCVVPSHSGAGVENVIVTNPDAQASNSTTYSYSPAPLVASLDKAGGSVFGQTPVQIFGNYFVQGATVTIGGVPCSNPVVSNVNSGGMVIACMTGAHNVSTASETTIVTNPDTQNGILASSYLYRQAPNITSVLVQSGTPSTYNGNKFYNTNGGAAISITGTSFDTTKTVNGPFVSFGGIDCSVTATTATQITCTLPAHSPGVVDVKVTNSDGQTVTSPGAFTYYQSPKLTSISPNVGSNTTNNQVYTITGSNFINDPSLIISIVNSGGQSFNCPTVAYINSTSVTCTWGQAISEGVYDVKVIYFGDSAVSGTLYAPYNYSSQADPVVSSITPAYGNVNGGTVVKITTSYLYGNETVTIGGSVCNIDPTTGYDLVNKKITCTTTSHGAGTGLAVIVTNTKTNKSSTAQTPTFDYIGQPAISSISVGGTITDHLKTNQIFTINGTNFYTGMTVTIGGILTGCSGLNTSVQPNTINCTAPAHADGVAEVRVINQDLQYGTLNINYWAAPQVNSVDISSGTTAGGTKITISGSYFHSVSTVTLDSLPCAINSPGSTSIICTTSTSNGGVGPTHIYVTNGDNQVSNNNILYNYINTSALAWGTLGGLGFLQADSYSYNTVTTNVTQTLILVNTGDKNATIGQLSLSTDSNSSGLWLKGTDNCSNQTLNAAVGTTTPAGTCSVQITFLGAYAPSGNYNATLSATDSTYGVTRTISLTATKQ